MLIQLHQNNFLFKHLIKRDQTCAVTAPPPTATARVNAADGSPQVGIDGVNTVSERTIAAPGSKEAVMILQKLHKW